MLRHDGRVAESLVHDERPATLDPRMADARFGYAMALVDLRRYRGARDRPAQDASRYPDHPEFREALARLDTAAAGQRR